MNIIYALVFFMLLFLVVEILAIIFKITGLDISKARFQIISIITHTGFTTRESELILQHPIRRKIAAGLMILSYVGQATIISLIITAIGDIRNFMLMAVAVMLLFFILIGLLRNRVILNAFDNLLERYIKRQMNHNKKHKTIDEVLNLNEEFGVAEIHVEENSTLCGMMLKDAALKDRYIQVLTIDRGSHIIHFPKPTFEFKPADKLTVYGKIDSIKEFIREINIAQ
jgi:hypothetical protein